MIYERSTALMEAPLGDELVALDARAGTCFGFNATAAAVWRLLEQPRSSAELQAALLDEFEVDPDQCEREVEALLEDLATKGLVCSCDDDGAERG